LTYEILSKDLASPSVVALYWAKGPNQQDIIGPTGFQAATATASGSYAPITVPVTSLQNRPPQATYLIALADPEGTVDELNEDNNLYATPVALVAKLLQLEATGDIDILDETTGQKIPDVIWTYSDKASTVCRPISDGIADGHPGVTIDATFECSSNPSGQVGVHWSLSGPSSSNGTKWLDTTQAGQDRWLSSFVITPPNVIGIYALTFEFVTAEGVLETISTRLYRTFDASPVSARYYDPHAGGSSIFSVFPERAFEKALALATGKTVGQQDLALEELMHGVFREGWTYCTDYNAWPFLRNATF
jgi:hypothetical protein